jgi:hypothetical protein
MRQLLRWSVSVRMNFKMPQGVDSKFRDDTLSREAGEKASLCEFPFPFLERFYSYLLGTFVVTRH